MKNKIFKIGILISVLFLFSGCTKYLSDKDGKNIIYEKTGQTITSNVICKPTDEDLIKVYEENKDKMPVKLDELPKCSTFKPNQIKYVSIWESIVVKPLAWIILTIGNLIGKYGISVMIVGLLIRIILMPLSKKTLVQSKKMKESQPELDKIEKKYANKTDNDSMMLKSQETMAVYKKHGISPFSGCIVSIIQLPLFFGFLEAINRVPAIFEENLFNLQLGTTPLKGIQMGNYLYIILIVLIIASTYFSMKDTLNTPVAVGTDDSQAKQSKYMVMFMLVFMSIASLNLPTAIALYWITTNIFAAVQSVIVKREK